jgi:hypothetical protein
MARRRAKSKTRRRRFKGVNLWNVAESLVQANIITSNWFGTDPLGFLVGTNSQGGYGNSGLNVSGSGIGLGELIGLGSTSMGAATVARSMALNNIKTSWFPVLSQTVGTRVGFALGKRLTRGIRADFNKGMRMVGLQNEVKM